MKELIVIGLSNSNKFEKRLAKELKAKTIPFNCDKFPDGELHLKFNGKLKGKNVLLVQSLSVPEPNDALIELLFAAIWAKKEGAKKAIAVIPYLAYMRQDKEFHAGEVVSAKCMAKLLNNSLDGLIAIDPHLHRIKKMKEIFSIPAYNITAVHSIAEFIAKKFSKKDTIIVGPDWESFQWARHVAKEIKFKAIIFRKERFTARRVQVHYSQDVEIKGKNVIIIDDMISTGHTMIEAIKELKKKKPKAIYCVCVHAILAENAEKKILKAGAKKIYSCNSIPSHTNAIKLEKIAAEEVRKRFR